ncbi:MAG: hypothetical protein JJE55_11155 [Flavobacteriaceae bacterium]|nr:hypothetical protein [Flavobacteriaceae bacterium]
MKFKLLIIAFIVLFSCKEESRESIEDRVKNQIALVNSSKEYSDMAVKVMNSGDEGIVERNRIESFEELMKKALSDAEKVDTDLLNDMRKGFGTNFSEKYIKGIKLQLESFQDGNAKKMVRGQILYDEYVDWTSKNLN